VARRAPGGLPVLASCSAGAPNPGPCAHAGFPDVGALAPTRPVEVADITVGHDDGLCTVFGDHARVDLTINRKRSHVPRVSAT